MIQLKQKRGCVRVGDFQGERDIFECLFRSLKLSKSVSSVLKSFDVRTSTLSNFGKLP